MTGTDPSAAASGYRTAARDLRRYRNPPARDTLSLSFRAQREISVSREYRFFVYILVNRTNRVMHVGMTNDLMRRMDEHREKVMPGFTSKYNVNRLVYFEQTSDVFAALAREKQIKAWCRRKKNALVIATNPDWRDLLGDFSLRSK